MIEHIPYIKLVANVLLRGVIDHRDNVIMYGDEVAMDLEPARWIMSNEQRVFGFEFCCNILHISPDRYRSKMNTMDSINEIKRLMKERDSERK